jgi:hypothetical protein
VFNFSDESAQELEEGFVGGGGAEPGAAPPGAAMPPPTMPASAPAPGPSPAGPIAVMPPASGGDASLRAGAAKALFGVTVSMLLGAWVAGPRGAAAGVSLFGTFRNANRARKTFTDPNPEVRVEAGKSATMAVFGAGIAGMLLYHEWKARNDDE